VKGKLLALILFWVYLAGLVTLWKSFPSALMNRIFIVGAVSLFATGAIYLYRQRQR
jgi:hypothetical protein